MKTQNEPQQKGFTLVEMLVVAPIVILAIGAFLTAIISMTGEVLASRASNSLSFNVQDALNRIEQDVKLSNSFLATNNIPLDSSTNAVTTNHYQGYNDDTTAFTSIGGTSGTSLILSMVATTTNPISTSSSYVYLKNKPNDCSNPQGNIPFTYNIVYYVKNNTLYRRVIMPNNYADTTSNVCAVPWQQPSCSPSYMAAQSGSVFCKTSDVTLVSGISATGFTLQYFNGENTSSINAPASTITDNTIRGTALQSATTVGVSLDALQTAAGRAIERAAILRVSRLDSNASGIATITTDGAPAAPNVSSTTSEPTNVTFSWPKVTTATGYTFEYQIGSGSWNTGFTNQATQTFTVTNATHQNVVNARVTAINATGNSGYGTATVTIPLWTPLALQNTWTDYSPPYSSAAYTKTSAGLIVLKGMVKAGSGIIGYLPAGYRPAAYIMFENSTNSAGGRVDIRTDGSIYMSVGSNAWFSLDGMSFMPSGTTFTPASYQYGWLDYSPGSGDPNWQAAGYTYDGAGRVQLTGLVRAGTTTSGTAIFNLPLGYRPTDYMYILNDVGNAPTHFSINANGNVEAKGYGNVYLSLQEAFYPASRVNGTTCTTQWCTMPLANGWQNYGAPTYASALYTKGSDGLVLLKGLISNPGSATQTIATLPAGYCPAEQLLMATASNGVWARIDVIRNGDGSCNLLPGAGASNVWFAMDDLRYMAE